MITPVGLADRTRSLVRHTVVDSVLIVVVTGFATFVALVVFGRQGEVILRAGFAVVALLLGLRVLYNLVSYLYGDGEDSGGGGSRARSQVEEGPTELFDLEDRVSLAMVSAFDHQSRLRPLIRELAMQRLVEHRHIDIRRQRQAARASLGPQLWNEIEPPPIAGDPRDAPGPNLPALRKLVDDLEAI
jgi:hypothetical protein